MASILRSVLGATTIAFTLPLIDAYGAAATYLVFTVIIWTSYGYVVVPKSKQMDSLIMRSNSILCYIIKYGDEMRGGINIGFSDVEDSSKPLDST